jgi:hypothetical protein
MGIFCILAFDGVKLVLFGATVFLFYYLFINVDGDLDRVRGKVSLDSEWSIIII